MRTSVQLGFCKYTIASISYATHYKSCSSFKDDVMLNMRYSAFPDKINPRGHVGEMMFTKRVITS